MTTFNIGNLPELTSLEQLAVWAIEHLNRINPDALYYQTTEITYPNIQSGIEKISVPSVNNASCTRYTARFSVRVDPTVLASGTPIWSAVEEISELPFNSLLVGGAPNITQTYLLYFYDGDGYDLFNYLGRNKYQSAYQNPINANLLTVSSSPISAGQLNDIFSISGSANFALSTGVGHSIEWDVLATNKMQPDYISLKTGTNQTSSYPQNFKLQAKNPPDTSWTDILVVSNFIGFNAANQWHTWQIPVANRLPFQQWQILSQDQVLSIGQIKMYGIFINTQ